MRALVACVLAMAGGFPGIAPASSLHVPGGPTASAHERRWDGVPPLICPAGERCQRPRERPPVCFMETEDLLRHLEADRACDPDAWDLESAGPGADQ